MAIEIDDVRRKWDLSFELCVLELATAKYPTEFLLSVCLVYGSCRANLVNSGVDLFNGFSLNTSTSSVHA
jgi:hypothetical protein